MLCFDTLLEVLILKVVSPRPMWCRLEASLSSNLQSVRAWNPLRQKRQPPHHPCRRPRLHGLGEAWLHGEKQVPFPIGIGISDPTRSESAIATLGMTPGARGHRAGGSEDPPLQLTGGTRAEARMRGPGSAALAAIGKGERTQRGTVLGAMGGHGSLQKERLDLGFLGSLAEARRTSERK